jgi:hypothetical protein
MLLIFGIKGYAKSLVIVMLVCQNCGTPAAHRIEEYVRKFTLFFVPLFRISRKYSMTCTFCAQTTSISEEQAQHAASTDPNRPTTIEPARRDMP